MKVQTGDWVRSYTKGIWQIVRELPEHFEPRYALDAPPQLAEGPHYLLKRLVNEKWKPAFAMESAQASFVKPLTKADAGKLKRFLAENPAAVEAFASFTQPVNQILNLPFSLAKKGDFRPFKTEFEAAFAEPLRQGMTSDAILKIIARSNYAGCFCQNPRNATLQFCCEDLEIKRRHFIYRQLTIQLS